MTDMLSIPQYLIEDEKEELQDPKSVQKYNRCGACGEFVHVNDANNHRRMYCDPGHKRKRRFVTRPMPKKLVGGFVLGFGVDPRPIENPPVQILRGKCRACGVILALPEDIRCIVCSGRA